MLLSVGLFSLQFLSLFSLLQFLSLFSLPQFLKVLGRPQFLSVLSRPQLLILLQLKHSQLLSTPWAATEGAAV